jgi:hypothetical protein
MLAPEVVLRFRAEDGGEPLYIGASGAVDLAREVAERLVAEAESAAADASAGDATLAALLDAEAARLRCVLDALALEPFRLLPPRACS